MYTIYDKLKVKTAEATYKIISTTIIQRKTMHLIVYEQTA